MKLNLAKTTVAAMIAMGIVSLNANAAPTAATPIKNQGGGEIIFKGEVIDAPCGISTESSRQTIDFHQISKAHLNNNGVSKKQNVDIKLVNCDIGSAAKKVKVTFHGTTADTANTMLGAGSTGAGIAMSGPDGKSVVFNKENAAIPVHNGEQTLRYQAWVQKNGGATVTEGAFDTTATFALAYE